MKTDFESSTAESPSSSEILSEDKSDSAIISSDPQLRRAAQAFLAPLLRAASERPIKQIIFAGATPDVGTSFFAKQILPDVARIFGRTLLVEVSAKKQATAPLSEDVLGGGEDGPYSIIHTSVEAAAPHFTLFGEEQSAFIEMAKKRFSIIIWDMPSPTICPETLLASSNVDGVVIVVQNNKTRKQVAAFVADEFRRSGANLMGVVLSRVVNHIPNAIYRML